jgi:hypothetical protein
LKFIACSCARTQHSVISFVKQLGGRVKKRGLSLRLYRHLSRKRSESLLLPCFNLQANQVRMRYSEMEP